MSNTKSAEQFDWELRKIMDNYHTDIRDVDDGEQRGEFRRIRIQQVKDLFASLPELTEIPASEVRKQRPMYMNREDAIKMLCLRFKADYLFDSIDDETEMGYAVKIVDTLIDAGHLTNHLPEGKTNVLTDAEIEKMSMEETYRGLFYDHEIGALIGKAVRDEMLKRIKGIR